MMTFRGLLCLFACVAALVAVGPVRGAPPSATAQPPEDWKTASPRDEIRPAFSYDPAGGRDGHGCLRIEADGREGLDGSWVRAGCHACYAGCHAC
jgi:hypothetical protein